MHETGVALVAGPLERLLQTQHVAHRDVPGHDPAVTGLEGMKLEDRLAFADAALKRWRGEPVFELHAFEARHRGVVPWNIPMHETLRLEQALERARDNGDSRLVHRIIEVLSGPSLPFGGPPRGGFGGGFN
jgi:hypothetical protein